MASGNRVEDLESRVRELEATVSGLTDELLETRERLHALEAEVDIDRDIIEAKPTVSESAGSDKTIEPADGAEADKTAEDNTVDKPDAGSSDDIIVA